MIIMVEIPRNVSGTADLMGGGSLPDQRLLLPAAANLPHISPVTAVVRVGTGRIRTLHSRQLHRLF